MTETENQDRIAKLFQDKTILITGASGFVGKVLLEKILRSCSDVKKVYVFIRNKYNKDINTRLKEIFDKPLFDLLKKEQGVDIFKKVEAINGDLSAPDLDLSQTDRQKLCHEVEIIYHVASTIRFDAPLKESTLLNVRGTKLMLDLAKECQNIQFFMYCSTAFCQVNEQVVEEKTYSPSRNPHKIIEICEYLEHDLVEKIQTELLAEHPNTYSFTKALAEGLVNEQMNELPAVIVRPSVVIPIMFEPLKGFSDSLNGPMGILIAAGKGVLRTMHVKGEGILDYVPVDVVASAMIFVTYDYITEKGIRKVYNITANYKYKIKANTIADIGRSVATTKYPFNSMLWYPGGSATQFKLLHWMKFLFLQLIPAIFLDFILILVGQKPFLIKVQKKLLYAYGLFGYYVNKKWTFNNDGYLKGIQNLNSVEKEKYPVEIKDVNFYEYFTECTHAARLYVLKESDDRLKAAKRLVNVMWIADILLKFTLVVAAVYYVHKKIVEVLQ